MILTPLLGRCWNLYNPSILAITTVGVTVNRCPVWMFDVVLLDDRKMDTLNVSTLFMCHFLGQSILINYGIHCGTLVSSSMIFVSWAASSKTYCMWLFCAGFCCLLHGILFNHYLFLNALEYQWFIFQWTDGREVSWNYL